MDQFVDKELENIPALRRLNTYLVGHNGFVAGGCFKNLINGEDIKDIDVYFRNEKDWADADDYFSKDDKYTFVYENDKVRAYKNKYSKLRVELIRALYGTPAEIINEFDFTVCKFAYYAETSTSFNEETKEDEESTEFRIVHHPDFFEHLHMKRLVIDNKVIRPGSTFERTYKYYGYGYKLCKESKVNLIEALRSDDFNPDDLSASLYDGLD